MTIAGLQKLSLIDYPEKISAVVFLMGCNFRCPFCQNPELVDYRYRDETIQIQISEKDFFKFLESRKELLSGVCITGGEPTINSDLPEFISKIKKLGFSVKLDTNISNPLMIEKLINGSEENLIDYFAIDIKSSPENYSKAGGVEIDIKKIEESLKIISESKIPFELRTTSAPGIIDKEEISKIKKWLKNLAVLEKAEIFAIQQFRNEKTLDEKFKKVKPYSDDELKSFGKIMEPYVKKVEIRGI
jgi:pyruvate formate lyase activating enzyme